VSKLLLLAFEQQVLQEQDGGRKDGALMNAFGLKEHIATCSHLYDNVLAFASTSVDTAYSDGGEDEKSAMWVKRRMCTTTSQRRYEEQ